MFRIVLIAAATIFGAAARYIYDPDRVLQAFVVGGLVLGVCLFAARENARSRPRLAAWLFQTAYLAVFLIVAVSAFAATWLALTVPGWLSNLPKDEAQGLTGVILGSLATLVGAAWLDDASKEDGRFWPEAQHRKALQAAFSGEAKLKKPPTAPRSPEMEKLYAAVYFAPDQQNDIEGWSFSDRLKRAEIVARYD